MMITLLTLLTAIWGAILSGPGPASVAEVDQILGQMEQGVLVFSYPTRDGVRGDGQSLEISLGRGSQRIFCTGHWNDDKDLAPGPAMAMIAVRGGRIDKLDISVNGNRKAGPDVQDLGTIDPGTAAAFFLQHAPDLEDDPAQEALLAAVIARDAEVAEPLLYMVRNRSNSEELRQDALMWVAVLAGEKALAPLRQVIEQKDEGLELREHAVFALGQLQHTDTLPLLLEIARNQEEPHLQQAAFFVLAEHDTPQVHQLFEEILLGN